MRKRLEIALLSCLLLMGCVLWAPYPTAQQTPSATLTPSAVLTATLTTTPTGTSIPIPTATAPFPDWADLSLYRQAMLPAFAADVDRFADATRYWIDLEVDPDALTFSGSEWVRFTNHERDPLAEIVLRLFPGTPGYGGSLTVQSVSVNGKAVDFDLQYESSAVLVPLAAPLSPGETVELHLAFVGTLPADASAGYAPYGYIDGVLALPDVYPVIPVYDDERWNVELARPYGDATFTDTSLYLVRLTLPAEMVLAVSGVIVAQQENEDGTVTYMCASGPMRDFNAVASADYGQVRAKAGQVWVTSYYLPGDRGGGELALDYAVKALGIYEQLFGPYPFTELDVVATPTKAGGIEYPGLIVIAEPLYDGQGGFFELVAVHEVAHQWWYSLVGNDQLDEPWLDESLTQYASLLYFEHRYGEVVAQEMLESSFLGPYRSLLDRKQDMAIGLPVAAYTEDLYGAVVYGKGPLFFHELRQQVGDEVFTNILRTYFERHRYGVAYPQDLLAVAEEVSGRDLDALYKQWVLGD